MNKHSYKSSLQYEWTFIYIINPSYNLQMPGNINTFITSVYNINQERLKTV